MISFSVRRPVTVIMFSIGLIVLGVISANRIQLRLLPPISNPEYTIVTNFRGATPKEIEKTISTPIEKAMSTESGLYKVDSFSEKGRSIVNLKFTSGIDQLQTLSNIREKLDGLSFGKSVSRPKIIRFNPNAVPVLRVAIKSKFRSPSQQFELARFLKENLVRKLENISGVAVANLLGSPKKQIEVRLDPLKALSYQINSSSLPNMIVSKNKDLPGGEIKEGAKTATVRLGQKIESLSALNNLVVKKSEDKRVRLKDFSTTEIKIIKPEIRTHLNGNDSLILEIQKESEANTVNVAKKAKDFLLKFFKENKDVDGVILIDQGIEIKSSIDNVMEAVIHGGFLAAIVIFLFLQAAGPTTVVALSIPMSLMITLILMYFTGVSFNLMSLGGLALGVGMLVDNSIVVLENINRMKAQMDDLQEAVIWGTTKVASAITSSTLTTIAVFAPLIFVEGMVGQLFRDISLTVVYSLSSSLFVAMVLIPCLSSLDFSGSSKVEKEFNLFHSFEPFINLIKKKSRKSIFFLPYYFFISLVISLQIILVLIFQISSRKILRLLNLLKIGFFKVFGSLVNPLLMVINKGESWLKEAYAIQLAKDLKNKKLPLGFIFVLFVSALVFLALKGAELFPSDSETRFTYTLEYPTGQALDDTEKSIRGLEGKINLVKNVEVVTSIIGESGSHTAKLMFTLKDPLLAKELKTEEQVREKFKDIPGLKFNKMSEGLISSARPIEIEVYSQDLNKLTETGKNILSILSKTPGIKNIETTQKGEIFEVNVDFSQELLDRYNIEMDSFITNLNLLLMGKSAGHIFIKGEQIPIVLRGNKSDFNNVDKIKHFKVTSDKTTMALSQVANIKRNQILSSIKHIDRKRALTISADLDNVDLKKASALIKKNLKGIPNNDEIKWSMGGQDAEREKSEKSLMFAILLSIFLIYILLASQFESFRQPIIILFAVPLCLIGVAVFLGMFDMSVSALVFIGFIILAGISVNTSIVLVDTMNQNIFSGAKRHEAILDASKNRLRPILMTTMSTVVGLLPMAIGFGKGASMRQPLAITVIGGLLSSTLFTIVVVPLIYDLISRKRDVVD